MNSKPEISRFKGAYRFLSNFHPCEVKYGKLVYPSLEHAFQASKTKDPKHRKKIQQTADAGEAKRLGSQVPLREDWEEVKLRIMEKLLLRKFSQPDLRRMLLATGEAVLIEGNWWGDTCWGVCKGEGKNHLGILLMKVRDTLRGKK